MDVLKQRIVGLPQSLAGSGSAMKFDSPKWIGRWQTFATRDPIGRPISVNGIAFKTLEADGTETMATDFLNFPLAGDVACVIDEGTYTYYRLGSDIGSSLVSLEPNVTAMRADDERFPDGTVMAIGGKLYAQLGTDDPVYGVEIPRVRFFISPGRNDTFTLDWCDNDGQIVEIATQEEYDNAYAASGDDPVACVYDEEPYFVYLPYGQQISRFTLETFEYFDCADGIHNCGDGKYYAQPFGDGRMVPADGPWRPFREDIPCVGLKLAKGDDGLWHLSELRKDGSWRTYSRELQGDGEDEGDGYWTPGDWVFVDGPTYKAVCKAWYTQLGLLVALDDAGIVNLINTKKATAHKVFNLGNGEYFAQPEIGNITTP